ncbi:hypothetical protein EVAR_42596_1 [Eumeta japonica]|uniref:Uncharacterized protein n=1 Tax=Eumeta variegata TaxID=151549 RepID=A0A4C1XL72_EUMVA|nr:hypothetical protein EVAR_42596_1 [Eumeta japonica]
MRAIGGHRDGYDGISGERNDDGNQLLEEGVLFRVLSIVYTIKFAQRCYISELADTTRSPTMIADDEPKSLDVGCGLEARIGLEVPQLKGDNCTLDEVGPVHYKVGGHDPFWNTVALY